MNFKRLVLGTAAGALAVTGAQAADLPVVVEPVDYVQICSAYGEGYFFIPGTEGCLRIRGRVRTDFTARVDLEDNGIVLGGRGFDDFADTGYQWRARGNVSLDHITETEFGQLQTFMNFQMQRDSGVGINGTPTDGAELVNGFIRLGGLLVGRTASNFQSVTGGNEVILDVAGANPDTLQIAYTASFGNGFAATLALEDTTQRRPGIVDFFFPFAFGAYGGAKVPDLIGKLEVSQGWGSANLSGAVRYLEVARTNGVALAEVTEEFGFAVAGNVSVNLPFGNATKASLGAGYSSGATNYILGGLGSFGALGTDGVYNGVPGGVNNFNQTEALAIGTDLQMSFTPTVAGRLSAGYAYIENASVLQDASRYALQGSLEWKPVTDFKITAGVEYQYIDFDAPGTVNDSEGSGIGAYVRLQRDF